MSYLGRSAKLSLKAQEKVSFLATAGQTVKTGLSYTPSFIEVYVNGVLLTDTTDFTATNGNSVTFTVALLLNDEVTVISLKTFTVADHYTKSDADTLLAAKATNTAVALKAPIASPSFTGGISVTGSTAHTAGDITNSISGSYKLFGQNGTAGSTAYVTYCFEGDNNTGMRHPAADNIGLVTGGLERLRIDSSGIIKKPYQPCFSVRRNSSQTYNANSDPVVALNDKHFDVGNNFNTSTYRFTAPVAGKYLFTAVIQYGSNGTSHSCFYINGGNPRDGWVDFGDTTASTQTRILTLTSGDYVELKAYSNQTTNLTNRSRMTGFLIG